MITVIFAERSLSMGDGLNLWTPMVVLGIATVTMALLMWTIATSGGFSAKLVPVARRLKMFN